MRFGKPYQLEIPAELSYNQLDDFVSQAVMRAIARLLPAALRGEFDAAPLPEPIMFE